MSLRIIMLGTAAAALLAVSPVMPQGFSLASTAQAQSLSVNISTFYDGLADDGDWVDYRGSYVFVPGRVDRDWRPYTLGRWVHTADYGWLWASDENFGWATYHYGRWGFGEDIGWYWVPGTTWAPAWVSWKRSPEYVVWAPLPPGGDDDVSINVSIGAIPVNYWVAVPARQFLTVNLRTVIVRNDRDRIRIVRQARDEGNVRVRGNIVVNNVIDVNFVEKSTGKRVRDLAVRKSDRRERTRVSGDSIDIFAANVKKEGDARPKRLRNVDEVRQARGDRRNANQDQTDANQVDDAEQQPKIRGTQNAEDQNAGPAQNVRKKRNNQNASGEQTDNPEVVTGNKKRQNRNAATEQTDNGDQVLTGKQKRANRKANANAQQDGNGDQQQAAPGRKKRLNQDANADENAGNGQNARQKRNRPAAGQADEQPVQRKKGRRGVQCDPSTGADCPS